ncbi:hypothetical protein CC_2663 [Caulobacter vibrioides CB15]|uniref:Uncharacterized protein n=2 Tax=Caulobacter vibrioides TaxID=155892 RepID=Q9A508_CAUVC|nr:hypothetical protein CC_2663 [Caulobacter vibrioides CB15]ATC29503.1 hypothetical protein CA607_14400 [Caulobacter vibrioides]
MRPVSGKSGRLWGRIGGIVHGTLIASLLTETKFHLVSSQRLMGKFMTAFLQAPALARNRSTLLVIAAGIVGWVALNLAVLKLANGFLPFDRPNMAGAPFGVQMAMPTLGLIEQLALMGLVWLLTRKREPVDMAARAPAVRRAWAETLGLLAYAMAAQVGGWLLGPALGYRPFSFHIAGTLVGCSVLASPGEALVWAGYNFFAFALVPYLWFRRRYTDRDLNLISSNRLGDWLVIAAVLIVESAVQLAAMPGVFKMSPEAFMKAAPIAFLLYFFGTVLPTMVLIYAILLPRYLKLTGSTALSVILGGLTYALMHLVEGWSLFTSPRDIALSLLFVFVSYTGPGMFKAYVTLRTGNAWVHALGYHAVAPHVIVDAPMIAKVFRIV